MNRPVTEAAIEKACMKGAYRGVEHHFTHVLKAGKRVKLPQRIICLDTETQTVYHNKGEYQILTLGHARYLNNEKGEERDRIDFFNTKDIADWVDSKCNKAKSVTYIFGHNVAFDMNILDFYTEMPKRGWERANTNINDSIYIVDWWKKSGNSKVHIKVIDLFNWFKEKLVDIGKTVGLEKLDVDFKTVSIEDLQIYCRRDVEIVEKIVLMWIDFIVKYNLGTFRSTAAGQAFEGFKKSYMKDEICVHNFKNITEVERKAYLGGRNEMFKHGLQNERVTCLDFNSLYPSVMKGNQYPIRYRGHLKICTIDKLKSLMEKYFVIAELDIEVDEPCVGQRIDKLLFTTGKISGAFTTPSIEYLLSKNFVKKVRHVLMYDHAAIFDGYVDFFFALRNESKKSGDSVTEKLCKLLLNSLYGKFGQKKKKNVEVGTCDIGVTEIEYCTHNGRKEVRKSFAGKITIDYETDENTYDAFPAIAAAVTDYARMKLWNAMLLAGRKNVYYCDTDSLYVNDVGLENLKSLIDQNELGKLKNEGYYNDITFNVCKDYNGTKIEGIKRTYVNKIKGVDTKRGKKLDENTWKMPHFEKTATAIRNNRLDGVLVTEITKHLSREYTKGIIGIDGWVIPFTDEDITAGRHLSTVLHLPTSKQIFTIAVRTTNSSHKALVLLTRLHKDAFYDEVFTSVVGPRGGYTGKFEACPGWEMTKKKMADSIKLPKSIRKSRNKFIISFGYFRSLLK